MTLQEMVVSSNACIKTLSKSAKIHFSLYFVFLLYNVHVFVMCIFFVGVGGGGGGETIKNPFMEKEDTKQIFGHIQFSSSSLSV